MRLTLVLLVVSLVACGDATMPADATCRPTDDRIHFGLTIAPRDSATGAWLTAKVRAEDGAYVEILVPGMGMPGTTAPSMYFGAEERPGTYTITISSPGYAVWRRTGIVVARGTDCHVQGAEMVVFLPRAI